MKQPENWWGQTPEHWTAKRFKQTFIERTERSQTGEEMLMSVSAYTGVTPRSDIVEDGDFLTRAETLEGYKTCYPGDLVMNIMLAWNRGLGFSRHHGIVSPAYAVFRILDDGYNKFFDYLLRSDDAIRYFKAFSTGVIDSRLRLYPEIFGQMHYICPPKSEQIAIAAFLDRETAKIDALIEEQKRLIELLKEKRQAVISHAVTKGLNPKVKLKDSGIEWLGEVPEHWEVSALAYRYEVALGKMLDEKKITGNHLGFYLRNTDVQWGEINTSDLPEMDFSGDDIIRYSLKSGDLLVCEGGDVGRAAVWRGELETCFYQKALHRLRAHNEKRDSTDFFYFVLIAASKVGLFVQNGKATIAHLPAEAFRRYRFTFPPKAEQQEIVSYLTEKTQMFDTVIDEAATNISLLTERRSALISAAVTGKIDVCSSAQ